MSSLMRGHFQFGAPTFITVDRFLVHGVHEVAGILDGVLEVTDGVLATALAPDTLLGSLCLVLDLIESAQLWTDDESTKREPKGLKSSA